MPFEPGTVGAVTVTLITGCSTGIGYATALRLARDGHDVIATMRTPDACDLVSVASSEGLTLETRAVDVTNGANVDEVFRSVADGHGPIDVLVNNAGISVGGAFEDVPFEAYETVMQTNYFGALRCTKAVLPSMRERRSGCIVSVTSQGGRISVPTLSTYSGSKFALEAVMEALAVEVASFGVRVAIIEPGAIITAIINKANPPPADTPYGLMYKRFMTLAFHDFGRGSPAEVVAACIAEAISTSEPRLRWPVGQGAERNLKIRASLSDEDYIAMWNALDDATFTKVMLDDEAQ